MTSTMSPEATDRSSCMGRKRRAKRRMRTMETLTLPSKNVVRKSQQSPTVPRNGMQAQVGCRATRAEINEHAN